MGMYYDKIGHAWTAVVTGVITSYSIHYTKLYDTPRELECIRLNNQGNDYAQIQKEMGFKSKTAVNSLMSRCRTKLDAKDRTELLIKSQQLGIS